MKGITRMKHIATGLLLTIFCASPAVLADDTELFLGTIGTSPNAGPPNILFVLDTSGSMDTLLTSQAPYEPGTNYSGTCDTTRVYWSASGLVPDCAADNWFNRTALFCAEANRALDSAGFYTDLHAQFDDTSMQLRWEEIAAVEKDRIVECLGDSAKHGDGVNTSARWARDGDPFPWSDNQNDQINWAANGASYTLYHGNFINWTINAPLISQDRLEVVQAVTKTLVDSISGVNIGVMRFDDEDTAPEGGEGGPVIHAMEDIDTARTAVKNAIDALDHTGFTPLSETLYEAGLYFMGSPVDYGLNSDPITSVPASRDPMNNALYKPPTSFACQKNFIVLLTDGFPTRDVSADGKIEGLPNFTALTGAGACDVNTNSDGTTDGSCLDDMADYLQNVDVAPTIPGRQNVTTHTVGFAVDLPILSSTATRGGGDYVLADDTVTLSIALANLLTQIFRQDTTFSAPTISVNAFNRTQNLNDLFIAVFGSTGVAHWPGNLKKYQVVGGEIVGADMAAAVDPGTGFFKSSAQSFWAGIVDGAEVELGGAASQLPNPGTRNLYTFTGNPASYATTMNVDLTSSTHALLDSNANLTDAMLQVGMAGAPARADLIDFMRGVDVTDVNGNGDTTERRLQMGDPLHARPATVIYGGTATNPEAVVYVATNDGYLHAIDPADGSELWAFVPREKLGLQRRLYDNNPTALKRYGIDGNAETLIIDVDGDGAIEPGDKVYLYVGMRRGGDHYYAFDVTDKTLPKLMWVKSSNQLPGLGQTWSTPQVARLDIAGVPQNADNFTLIFGGGYDPSQDNPGYSTDSQGNSIYMVDAVSGDMLWHGSLTGSGADFEHPEMDNAIPADMKVLDMNGDDFADRMYVGDMGGRLWRFDIFNGQDPSNLVAGGPLASLGAADAGGTPPLNINRRFYNTPDVAPVATQTNGNYLHIGIGSGYRAHPLSSLIEDRFYSIRDRELFATMSQAQYDAITPIVEADLIDITAFTDPTVPATAPGWRFELRNPAAPGEKILAESRTLLGAVFFTSFIPPGGPTGDPCIPGTGTNVLHVVDIEDGGAVNNFNREITLKQGGIAPSPSFFFIPDDPDPDNCVGAACKPDLLGLIGVEPIQVPPLPPFFRTFWTQTGQIPAPPPPP